MASVWELGAELRLRSGAYSKLHRAVAPTSTMLISVTGVGSTAHHRLETSESNETDPRTRLFLLRNAVPRKNSQHSKPLQTFARIFWRLHHKLPCCPLRRFIHSARVTQLLAGDCRL